MSDTIKQLEPKVLWNHFADLNAVPRPSKKEERVIQFMMDFGQSLGLETIKDHIGNVIIKKAASPGMEDRQTIVLQSHLDMVHQKNASSSFDFDKEGIKMLVEGDWVKADGTTLGADNGIGVATIMALLSSKSISHPPLEALFTIDEETGMTGALELKGGLLSGSIMLNLDTEDDRELCIGCAGGIDITAKGNFESEAIPNEYTSLKLSVTGLTGGHSGMDIHLGRGNANKIMNRLLYTLNQSHQFSIISIDGGGLRNAIPRESFAHISVKNNELEAVQEFLKSLFGTIQSENNYTDPNLDFEITQESDSSQCISESFQEKILKAIYACPNGIYRMSPSIDGLVQTSNNLARVLIKDGKYEILCLTRSSLDSEKFDLANAITSCFELCNAEVGTSGTYPGWSPKPEANIVKIMSDLYREKFNEEPDVSACHAGLECGILGQNYPEMDMISFGPNITGAHSPDEKVQISSVQKYWDFLLDTLKEIPKKV